jgi:hypothetical protein
VNVLSHEVAEAITDEGEIGWWVNSGPNAGDEMADLCNFTFTGYYYTPNGTAATETIGGRNFLVQLLWVNQETPQGQPIGCQQGWAGGAARTFAALRGRVHSRMSTTSGPHSAVGRPHIMPMGRRTGASPF